MAKIVIKFGGTSVGNNKLIITAKIIKKKFDKDYKIIVVV